MQDIITKDGKKIIAIKEREYRLVDERGVWVRFIKENNPDSILEAYKLGLYNNARKVHLNFTEGLKLVTLLFKDYDGHIYKKLSDIFPRNKSFTFKDVLKQKESNKTLYLFYHIGHKKMEVIHHPCLAAVILSIATKLLDNGILGIEKYKNIFHSFYIFRNSAPKTSSKKMTSKEQEKTPKAHIIYVPMGNDRRRR